MVVELVTSSRWVVLAVAFVVGRGLVVARFVGIGGRFVCVAALQPAKIATRSPTGSKRKGDLSAS